MEIACTNANEIQKTTTLETINLTQKVWWLLATSDH